MRKELYHFYVELNLFGSFIAHSQSCFLYPVFPDYRGSFSLLALISILMFTFALKFSFQKYLFGMACMSMCMCV